MKPKLEIIKVYKPAELEPHKRPEWNAGLFIVEYKRKKYELWSHRAAMEKAAELSTGRQLIVSFGPRG